MKEIVFLAGLLVILLYALGLTQQRGNVEGYEIVSSRKVGQNGDTLIIEQKMIRR